MRGIESALIPKSRARRTQAQPHKKRAARRTAADGHAI